MEINTSAQLPVIGHEDAQRRFLDAVKTGRVHHAWLITGPWGIGKATLARAMAEYLLSNGAGHSSRPSLFEDEPTPQWLIIDDTHSAVRQMKAGAHPDFRVIERGLNPKTGQLKNDISVDDIRTLSSFLGSTAAMGGWRIVIIDAADDMNRNAANALLKMLEEPPAQSIFLVISHSPGQLLPTIRSRCLNLALKPLNDVQVAQILERHIDGLNADEVAQLVQLSQGSPGLAVKLAEAGGGEIYALVYQILSKLPQVEMTQVFELAQIIGQARKQDSFATFIMVFNRAIESAVHWAAGSNDKAPWGAALPLGAWLEFYDEANILMSRGDAVNLDPRHVVISLFGNLKRRVSK